jgi:lipoprotein-releasing system permease protein
MDPLLLPGLLLLPNACWLLSPYTAPVWCLVSGPAVGLLLLVAAGVWGLARLSGHGLLFLGESYTGSPIELSRPLRPFFYLLAIGVFPVVITGETLFSVIRWLGGLPETLLAGGTKTPLAVRLVLGTLLLVTAPAWFLVVAVLWVVWLLTFNLGGATIGSWFSSQRVGGEGRFQTFVALRYMRGRKSSAGVTLVTALSVLGVTLGVWTLVVVLSVMAGFEKDLQDKILGANSHIVVLSYANQIEDWERINGLVADMDGVRGVTPFVYSEFMLRSKHTAIGAIFKGIHAETVGDVTDIADNLVQGPKGRIDDRADALRIIEFLDEPDRVVPSGIIDHEDSSAPKLPGILIGQEMAATLRVTVGDTVHAVSPSAEPGPMGTLQTRVFPFEVLGIFHSGMYEYDTKFSYASLQTASRIMKMDGAITGLEVVVDDIYEAPEIAGRIGAKLQYPYWTRDWQKMNEPLFAALRLEKYVMGIILLFIVAVAGMLIFSTLIMLVIEKSREIAIMKAMGAGRSALMKLFMVDGLLIGFIGTTLGVTLGVLTCMALDRWQFIKLESDVYYVDTLPVELSASLTALVALLAVGIAFVATLLPSWAGGRVDPVEGLRDA